MWSGGGFNISYLKDVEWMAGKPIIYWGDIDEHGFQILHQLRSYYPEAESILMDIETFTSFEKYAVAVPLTTIGELKLLRPHEQQVLEHLKANSLKNRLEQERVSQEYASKIIMSRFPN